MFRSAFSLSRPMDLNVLLPPNVCGPLEWTTYIDTLALGPLSRARPYHSYHGKEFERLRGATAIGECEKKAMSDQLKALAEKNRTEKRRMDELLERVIHSQRGELEKRKEEYVDLQVRRG